MFAVEWCGNPVLRLAEADREKARATLGAKPWSPRRGPMKEYVEIPAGKLPDADALRPWLDRAMRYVRSLPERKARGQAKQRQL